MKKTKKLNMYRLYTTTPHTRSGGCVIEDVPPTAEHMLRLGGGVNPEGMAEGREVWYSLDGTHACY